MPSIAKRRGPMSNLFDESEQRSSYTAADIEVLEGLEPVRRRPGMYIGSTDESGLHHLVAELLDNSMDEAVAGHATLIELELGADGGVLVRDNGRGIPVDPHPKFKNKPALEVILTTLHSGGKFEGKVYDTSGGLHGVGLSVVNALADSLTVEVARDKILWRQSYAAGKPLGRLERVGAAPNRRGTSVRFHPDPAIFGEDARFSASRLYRMARSKAYLHRGVRIRWRCDPALLKGDVPAEAELHFPGGLADFLDASIDGREPIAPQPFTGTATFPDGAGRVEWAATWIADGDGFAHTYCNTIPTPLGGSHEAGFRAALLKGLKAYGELIGSRRAPNVTADDLFAGACLMLSVFIREPRFQGQTKEKLDSPEATRLVEAAVRDHFDHWLGDDPVRARALLDAAIERFEERLRRKQEKELDRKSATSRKLRLPGKLADCSVSSARGTELFLVEGDSAGGSAKQARERATQAVLPLRGKILNVASASADKLRGNQELADLVQALGCGTGSRYDESKLRYERIIIMTDADVDGAHIASLLMTFFLREMPQLIEKNHLYLAQPPLYRLVQGGTTIYARDDAHKDQLLKSAFKGKKKVEISRFKGLGEMPPAQLKATTMSPASRTLLRVSFAAENGAAGNGEAEDRGTDEGRPASGSGAVVAGRKISADLVDRLMGRKPELRLAFIQENARFAADLDV
jgi:topoisomerase IV subunit B